MTSYSLKNYAISWLLLIISLFWEKKDYNIFKSSQKVGDASASISVKKKLSDYSFL